jgi:mRNA interferase RelE/StbE
MTCEFLTPLKSILRGWIDQSPDGLNRIQWLAEHFDDLKPELLAGTLSGFYKFRVGDYRIIYKVYKNENLMVIHGIGHRREVYKL